jgi:opacity protein-like surface antigen
MAFGSLLILSASAFGADRPTEDVWSVRTMGIWSDPYENDLRILTNGDELELGFDDSFGFSAAIGWQPKEFAFGFELEYRSTEHDLVSGNLPELGTIEADATRSVETIFLNAVARQKLGLDITIFGGVGLGYSSIDFDLRSLGGDTDFDVGQFSEDTIAFQGFVGFEKAITDDLGFVTQLGWFQADEPRLENELTQPFTMDVKSPSLSVGLRYEF